MSRAHFKILIVEDDPTLGKAMAETLKRDGYQAILVARPEEAITHVKLETPNLAIVDCMLPKMNGVELVMKMQEVSLAHIPVILTSGVFKNRDYIRESLQQTGAIEFLLKPFQPEDLKKIITNKLLTPQDTETRNMPVYNLMLESHLAPNLVIDAINECGMVHGYDLPWIYFLILQGKFTGHLSMMRSDGSVMSVGFDNGHIVQARMQDEETYFGKLIVGKGYVSADDLEKVVMTYDKKKFLGDVLVDMDLISQDAVAPILTEQLNIRLSKSIEDISLQIKFEQTEEVKQEVLINKFMFVQFIDDWILSKIKIDWLRAFYVPWMHYSFAKGPEFSEEFLNQSPFSINNIPNFLSALLTPGVTLAIILSQNEELEPYILRALHAHVLSRTIAFNSQSQPQDYESEIKRYEKINMEMQKQNHFERLGLSKEARETEIHRAYMDLVKVIHPDRLAPGTPEKLRTLRLKTYQNICESYEVIKDRDSRQDYLREFVHAATENLLHCETLVAKGKVSLRRGDLTKAKEQLNEAVSRSFQSTELQLLLLWCQMKSTDFVANQQTITHIKESLAMVSPDGRHSPLFYFVKGLLSVVSNDPREAYKYFEIVLATDREFIEARREMSTLKHAKPRKPDIFIDDISVVLHAWFKPKERKAR